MQYLQKCQIKLPSAYLQTLNSTFEKTREKLNELGTVEVSGQQDKPDFTVTAVSLIQIALIKDTLQDLEDRSMHVSAEDNEFGRTEIIQDVSQTVWKVVKLSLSQQLTELEHQNVSICFDKNSILVDTEHEVKGENLIRFIDSVNELKAQQLEEIKPTKSKTIHEYQKWCDDIEFTFETNCCVFDVESRVFIAFGQTYDDILKVKHQLGIKQGLVKQTGRKRNRNFDGTIFKPKADSGPLSLPSLTARSENQTRLKHDSSDFDWSSDAKEVRRYNTAEGISVYVYAANILKLPVDCIVNAANDTLMHGGGVAAVIANAAGSMLTEEGNRHVQRNGKIPVGKACTTTAGDLPYHYVIHAVGPRWHDFTPHTLKDVKRCESLLQNAILSSFCEAEKREMKTIALPAISSGRYSRKLARFFFFRILYIF